MNNKGEMNKIGLLIVTAVTIIIGLILISGGIAPSATQSTSTWSVTNDSVSAPTAIGGTIQLRGQAVQGNIFVQNGTGGETVAASNYTVSNYQLVNGNLVTIYNASGTGSKYVGSTVRLNMTYTYEPYGYITDSGSRAVAGLIVLMSVLALLVAILPAVRESLGDMMGI